MRKLFAIIVAVLTGLSVRGAPGSVVGDHLAELKAFFQSAEMRLPGSAGNLEMERRIADRFAACQAGTSGAITFQAPAFVPGETQLTLADGTRIEALPMHPSLTRAGNFRETEFECGLVYAGRGTVEDLAALEGVDLENALLLMEFDCGSAWLRLLRFGVRGFLFVGGDEYDCLEAQAKVPNTEVAVPRFFVPTGPAVELRDALAPDGRRTRLDVHVSAQPSQWENVFLRDPWVFIPGSDPDLEKDVVVITAPLDSNCVVPELAEGAQNGANLFQLAKLLDEFERTPPARSVLLVALNAHTQGFCGERLLAWHLLAPTAEIEGLRNTLAQDVRYQKVIIEQYNRLELDPPTDGMEELLVEFRSMEDRSTGRGIRIKAPVVAYAKRDVNLYKAQMLELQNSEVDAEAKQARRQELEAVKDRYVDVLTLFNKVGIRTSLSDIMAADKRDLAAGAVSADETRLATLRGYVDTVRQDYSRWVDLNEAHLARDKANGAAREVLAGRSVRLVISLEMTWNGPRIGFCYAGGMKATRLGANSVRVARELAGETESPFLDTMTNYAGLSQGYYFPDDRNALRVYYSTRTPAVGLRTTFRTHGPAFTPADSFDALDAGAVNTLVPYVTQFVRALLADRALTSSSELPAPYEEAMWSVHLKSFKFDEFAASVIPELPVPGSMVIVFPELRGRSDQAGFWGGDVVNRAFSLTDDRAACVAYGLRCKKTLPTAAYHLADDHVTVDHIIDAGEVHEKVDSDLTPTRQRIFALFECTEFPLWNTEDPSRVSYVPINVDTFLFLDPSQDSAPRKYGLAGVSCTYSSKELPRYTVVGPGAVYLDPGHGVKILANHRTVLNTDEEHPEGIGFIASTSMDADLFAEAARDLDRLNRYRLKNLRGVSNQLVNDYLARGRECLDRAELAKKHRDHLGYLRGLYEALGSEVKAYEQVSGITNDMLKAIVFYLGVLLPFCFFVGKLLFKFVRLEAQLAVFAVLFVLTFVLFRMIHPAFKIAQAPEAIFIGFVMLALALFVIWILHGRFEGEMQLLFLTYSGMDTTEVGYSTVGQKAMLIGVNNMKRRRIRTGLTTATIVLVTFTMLAFSSVSKKMSPTVIPVSKSARYTGVFYQWPGSLTMDEATLAVVRELFSDCADAMIVRRWLLPPAKSRWSHSFPLPLEASNGNTLQLEAVLGLAPEEDGFLGDIPLLGEPGRRRFFSAGNAMEAVLPSAAAEALGLTTDDVGSAELVFRGQRLTLVGIVDDERFRALRDLNNRPILPIKEIEQGGWGQNSTDANLDVDPTADESGVFYAESAALLIVPLRTAKRFGAQPFSVSVRLESEDGVWAAMDRLMTSTAARFYVGSERPFSIGEQGHRKTAAGVYYIGSGYKTSIGGLSRLIIPLLIAATIILNTMLGSVYERKNEIAVYNAIGLNPTHIGLFFLAEAFVYSIIGSVGGYLIGQMLTLGLAKFRVIQGINLNFSSLSVVYVILFTIAVVLLSTLYPAVVATRAAVPSGKRKWSMPDIEGEEMQVTFPFIYSPKLAPGVMAYLEEYFARFTEASVGELIAACEDHSEGRDAEGRSTYALRYNIALAPFDLGVTQYVDFAAHYDDIVQSYRVHMTITRISGQDSNWLTTNKPFLEKLRQYMMHWRNLEDVKHAFYCDDWTARR